MSLNMPARVQQREPLAAVVFAILGAALLVAALVLAAVGSFAFLAAASVGLFFVAAALIVRAIPFSRGRGAAVLALVGLALIVFGLTATPLFYAGWGLVAGSVVLAIIRR